MNTVKWNRFFQLLSVCIAMLGTIILLKTYLENRSLFIDELNLVRNVIELDYIEFFGVLHYEQYAPPLFLIILKALSSILGQHEYVLRLLPFLSGLIAIWLFFWYFKRHTSKYSMIYGLCLFVFSFPLLRHSTEVKQYSVDLLLCLVALILAEKYSGKSFRDFVLWIGIGIIGIWISMPFVFVLSGVGLMMLYSTWKDKESFLWPVITIISWLFSFGLLWYLVLADPLQSDYLRNYHNNYFLKLSWDMELYNQITGIFRNITCKSGVSIAFSLLFFGIGTYHLIKHQKKLALLWLTPIIVMMAASALQQYSIIERLMLFSFPLFYLILFHGFDALQQHLKGKWKYLGWALHIWAILTVVTSLVQRSSLHYMAKEYVLEEGREVWQQLASVAEDDPIILSHGAVPTYVYYAQYYKYASPTESTEVIFTNWFDSIHQICDSLSNTHDKVWVFDVHSFDRELQTILDQTFQCGEILDEIHGAEARAYLMDLTGR